MSKQQKDNSTFRHKLSLRRMALAAVGRPATVMETHGGLGKLYGFCYANATAGGTVFEKDKAKVDVLAAQRPTWAVYEGDCEPALADGAGSHLVYDFLDVDPYGSPFDVLAAVLAHPGRLADRVQLVVNDGLRQKVQLGGAWSTGCLKDVVADYGNNLYAAYLDVAKEKTRRLFGAAGYRMESWRGYYCGFGNNMTHYWAALVKHAAGPAAG